MNTMVTKLSHSIHIVLLTAILCCPLAFVSSLQAQSSTDAFYIYQNDGHFDGFFYDEVQSIQYSKLDTLGFEHTDYVSQEIVTADSIYRIMLTAIDSVGFVQPEVKINERIRDMQAEGLTWSLTKIDGQRLTFRTFLSNDVTESDFSVGDILLNYSFYNESSYLSSQSFSGRVTAITRQDVYTLIVDTEPITDPHEIYTKYTTVEEYSATETGQMVSRRVAGMPQMGVGKYAPPSLVRQSNRAGQIDLDLLNFNFTSSVPLNNNDIDINLTPSIEGKVNIKAVWDMPKYIGVTTKVKYGIGIGVEIDGSIEGELNSGNTTSYVTIPLPAAAPLFQLEVMPNLFIRGDAHVKFAMQAPKWKGQLWQKVEIVDYVPRGSSGTGPVPGDAQDIDEIEEPYNATASASLEGMVQAGLKFPLNLKTNSILSYVFKCAIGAFVYAGPKLQGSVSLDLKNVLDGDNKVYDNFKDSKLTFSPLSFDIEAKGKYKKFLGSEKEVTFYSTTLTPLSSMDLYFFPKFEDWEVKELVPGQVDEEGKPTSMAIVVKPTEWTPYPVSVGIKPYLLGFDDKEVEVGYGSTKWATDKYWKFKGGWRDKSLDLLHYQFSWLAPGPYRFYPVFNVLNTTIQANPSFDYVVPGLYLMIDKDTLQYGGKGGTRTFRIKSNAARIEAEPYRSDVLNPNASPPETLQFEYNGDQSKLTLPRKEGILTTHTTFHFTPYDEKGNKGETKTIRVTREPSFHISRFRLSSLATGPMQNGGNCSSVSLDPRVDIQLGNSSAEHFIYSESHQDKSGTTYTTRLNLTMDLSHPDSVRNFMSYQHITGGTLYYEEKQDYEEKWWDSEAEVERVDKYSYIRTHLATVKKNLYSSYNFDDLERGEFRHYWTQLEPDENGEWSTESGVDVKGEVILKKNGVEQYHSVFDENPTFELLILPSYQ